MVNNLLMLVANALNLPIHRGSHSLPLSRRTSDFLATLTALNGRLLDHCLLLLAGRVDLLAVARLSHFLFALLLLLLALLLILNI